MGRALKYFLFLLGGIVALAIVAVVSFVLLFDPNDFRDRIAEETKRSTGRDLVIEGDLEVSLFPWLAVALGRTTLGNAPGFGDEPFARFESARLSVRLIPLLLRREVTVGTAELDALELNLMVARDGRTNWDDLVEGEDAAPAGEEAAGGNVVLDIANIQMRDSTLTYRDAQAGDTYRLTDVNMNSGRVAGGQAVPLTGGLTFDIQPDALSGTIELSTSMTFDTDAGTITLDDLDIDGFVEGLVDVPATLEFRAAEVVADTNRETMAFGDVDIALLDIDIAASVAPFSYADTPEPVAQIEVEAFSPKSLLQRLDIEVPPTADSNALEKLILEAEITLGEQATALRNINMVLDDTKMTGSLSLPADTGGTIRFDLVADTINLSRYMAPADEAAAANADEVPVEIPTEMIKPLNVRGTLKVAEGLLGDMRFENVEVGVNSAAGKLRIHPVSAELYEGTYSGDVRIDASGAMPVLSVNEQLAGVKLGALVAAMFDQDNVTGTINGTFNLSGRGADLAAIQRDLSGTIALELVDGAYEGVDLWYELRRARALVKQEAAPKAVLPARTAFSNVRAEGPVTDGVFDNPDFLAELPFMQVKGGGTVNLPAATMDYRLTARVFDRPELMSSATPGELADFTKATIPLRISGPLTAPSVKPDIESLVKERVREEVKDRIIDKLLGGSEPAPAEAAPADGEAPADDAAPTEEPKDIEDQLKDSLRDIFKR